MEGNAQPGTRLKSNEVLAKKRKHSTDIPNRRNESEMFKIPNISNISDLDVSLIEKPSRTSEINKGNTEEPILSPFLKNNRPESPTHRPIEPAAEPKLSKSQQKRGERSRHSDQSEQQLRFSSTTHEAINWKSVWLYLKLILFSYEFNLPEYLHDIDAHTTSQVIELLKIAPGYKPIQYVYTFYMFKYGTVMGLLAAILYPLPYSILFLMITIDLDVPFVAIFMLAGMRSGAIALLLKYCFHFPKHTFNWIVLIFTVLIGILLPNNYIYILLFGISIFLSLYIKNTPSSSSPAADELSREENSNLMVSSFGFNFNEQEIYKEYKVYDKLPQTYPDVSIAILACASLLLWVLQRYLDNREVSIFGQIMPISLLMSSKEMLAFFPYIYKHTIGSSTLSPNTLISLSFLFPGPHSKAFMFFIVHTQIRNVTIGYLCLYLPSILLANIFIGYRPHFFTKTYYNIRQSIQAVGNGIVFCLVYWMLENEPCFFKPICYSAVVIMVVAKLYKLRELFAITLGIFLISSRTIILNINKEMSFESQACLGRDLE